jgi:hypothetical protein
MIGLQGGDREDRADPQRAKMHHAGQLLSIQYYCLKVFFSLWWRLAPFQDREPMTTQDPTTTPDDDDVERRFRAAGVVVPADRAEGAYAVARRLLGHLHWLRKSRTAAAEPAHIFRSGNNPS